MQPSANNSDPRLYLTLTLAALGVAGFAIGARPDWLGLARTPEVGFLQIVFMVTGMGFFAMGSIFALRLLWQPRRPLRVRLGARIAATGYVTVAAALMADILGMGSQTWPASAHFGPMQGYGVLMGEAIMALGLLLMAPYRRSSGK